MKALITGASSGMGRDMAIELSQRGFDLILVARRLERLERLKKTLKTNVEVICLDLSVQEECFRLFETVKDKDIDILINNAGFGSCGGFCEIPLEDELKMINVNIKAVHILTKLFLCRFNEKGRGYILNVASAAAFYPGPLMAAYYAAKAYVLRLTVAIRQEQKKHGQGIYIGAFCPGPVETEFGDTAGFSFKTASLTSKFAAKYAIDNMFKNKAVIVPGFLMKVFRFLSKLIPDKALAYIVNMLQTVKQN